MQKNKFDTLEYLYQEFQIHFLLNTSEENMMINATEMAKVFGRQTKIFLRKNHAKNYIEFLSKRAPNGVQIIDDRGRNGIYFHRKLAVKFAMWLDIEFEDWIIDTIDKIIRGKLEPIKKSISNIHDAENKLNEAIKVAKESGNIEAIAIVEAFQAKELAKINKTKAMKRFSRQIQMDF